MNTTPAYTIEQRDGFYLLTHTKTGNTAEVFRSGSFWFVRNLTFAQPGQEKRKTAIEKRFLDWWKNTPIKTQL